MNPKQIKVISVGLCLMALCAFFPPRKYVMRFSTIYNGTPSRVALLSSNLNEDGRAAVDSGRLLAECLFLGAATGFMLLRKSKES